MDRKEIKNRIDFNNIQELEIETIKGLPDSIIKTDYLVDFEGNFIIPLSPLNVKLIEWIKDLEVRILALENK